MNQVKFPTGQFVAVQTALFFALHLLFSALPAKTNFSQREFDGLLWVKSGHDDHASTRRIEVIPRPTSFSGVFEMGARPALWISRWQKGPIAVAAGTF